MSRLHDPELVNYRKRSHLHLPPAFVSSSGRIVVPDGIGKSPSVTKMAWKLERGRRFPAAGRPSELQTFPYSLLSMS